MKRMMLTILLCLAVVMTVYAGVTEIKIYSNDNPARYYGDVQVGPNAAANYLGVCRT